MRQEIVYTLKAENRAVPQFKTENKLGDYHRIFDEFNTETDVKTKIMILNSNPKGYNLDKILEFLSEQKTVFMFYFIGVNPDKVVSTVLVSMFQFDLLNSTILLRHWAGRNSRGVTQFEGKTINDLILNPRTNVVESDAIAFLKKIVAL